MQLKEIYKTLHKPTLSEQEFISLTESASQRSNYKVFWIPKPNGTKRMIEEPQPELKEIQRALLPVLSEFPLHPTVYGLGGSDRCAVANAKAHVLHRVIVKMDIKQFFPNTWLHQYLYAVDESTDEGFAETFKSLWPLLFIRDTLVNQYRLPTGAPTSPLVSSIAFTPMDTKLHVLALQYSMNYTRYIDDLTFSGDEYPDGLQKKVAQLVGDYGYAVNHKKSQLLYRGNHTQIVTGVCINEGIGIGKAYKRTLRAELDKYAREGKELDEHMHGKLNYVRQLSPSLCTKFQEYFLNRRKHFANPES
jgi:retron-type reverse transcriptase